MISYLKGKLVLATPLYILIDLNGMGYKVFIPANAFFNLPSINTELLLHTSFVIREYSQALYGFLQALERDLFEELMNVSGIGPKLALSIIGNIEINQLNRALQQHDKTTLSKIPGIGKKTAERLIIEMRDKIGSILPPNPSEYAIELEKDPQAQMVQDAMNALINLGYNQVTAQKAIKKTLKEYPEGIDLPVLITHALKHVNQ